MSHLFQKLNQILVYKAFKEEKNKATEIDSIDVANILTANNSQNAAALLAAEKSHDRLRISESKSESINKEKRNYRSTSSPIFEDSYQYCHGISSKVVGDNTINYQTIFVSNWR